MAVHRLLLAIAVVVAGCQNMPGQGTGPDPDDARLQAQAKAALAARPIDTTRGKATVPVWTFTLAGTSVVITRVAVQRSVTVEPPPWDPTNPPVGISIDRAQISSDDMSLTVSFVGAPDPGSKPCGEDYTAEAVESDSAVVGIVHVHRNPTPGGCSLVGFERFATARLAAPLAGRAVLEVGQGLPVVVVPG